MAPASNLGKLSIKKKKYGRIRNATRRSCDGNKLNMTDNLKLLSKLFNKWYYIMEKIK